MSAPPAPALRPRAVHQLVPRLSAGDAVSAHALEARSVLRDMGFESRLFAGEHDGSLAEAPEPARRLPLEAGQVVVYQHAIGTSMVDGLAPRLAAAGVGLVLNHHTSSPPELFDPWDRDVAALLRLARHQLGQLAPACRGAIAVSQHNAAELRAAGCRHVEVAPVLTAPTAPRPAAPARPAAARGRGARWLFVGRVVPNKAQHHLVEAFALYRRTVDADARLTLVGVPLAAYGRAVDELIAGLGLDDAVERRGLLSPAELAAAYARADVFVCLSDHEGFCVPLLEAFRAGLPVVAYDAGAVRETLGGAGLCLPDKSPAVVATAVGRVLGDEALRDALVAAGRRRAAAFEPAATRAAFAAAVERVLGTAA